MKDLPPVAASIPPPHGIAVQRQDAVKKEPIERVSRYSPELNHAYGQPLPPPVLSGPHPSLDPRSHPSLQDHGPKFDFYRPNTEDGRVGHLC